MDSRCLIGEGRNTLIAMVRNEQRTRHQWSQGALLMLEETQPKTRVVGLFTAFPFGVPSCAVHTPFNTHRKKRTTIPNCRKWHSVCPPQCLLAQVEIAFLISMFMVYSVGRPCFFNHIEMSTIQAAGCRNDRSHLFTQLLSPRMG